MRTQRGQIVLEYLLVGAVVASVTILAFATFDDTVRQVFTNMFDAAADEVAH